MRIQKKKVILWFESYKSILESMTNVKKIIRRYPLSSLLTTVIWVLCLVPWIPETPLSHVSLIDKWTHLVMYGTLVSVIWWEYLRQHSTLNARRLLLLAFLAPLLMGGLVELAQAYCTAGHRSGEWLDFAANSLGTLIGTLIGLGMSRFVTPEKSW